MANYLYNGVKLPDINAVWDKTTYPYAFIVHHDSYNDAYDRYELWLSATKPYMREYSGLHQLMVVGSKCYYLTDGVWILKYDFDTEWYAIESQYEGDECIWSNVDILDLDGSILSTASGPVPDDDLYKEYFQGDTLDAALINKMIADIKNIDKKSEFSGKYEDLEGKPEDLATIEYVDSRNYDDKYYGKVAGQDLAATLAEVKEDVDLFFKDANLEANAKDTLKEIQDYIKSDASAAAEMVNNIASKLDKVNPTGSGSLSLNRKDNSDYKYVTVVGTNNSAINDVAFTSGEETQAGWRSHTEGYLTIADNTSHAEGRLAEAHGKGSHAEGIEIYEDLRYENQDYVTLSQAVHIDSNTFTVNGNVTGILSTGDLIAIKYKPDEESDIVFTTDCKRIVGNIVYDGKHSTITVNSKLRNEFNVFEGHNAPSDGIFPIGSYLKKASINITGPEAEGAHSEGKATKALGIASHSEGLQCIASGLSAHAEGREIVASGNHSHTEGWNTKASGISSHAEGSYTIATGNHQHVEGKYNVADTEKKYAHIVGWGTSDTNRKNIHTIDTNGNADFSGDVRAKGEILATQSYVDQKAHIPVSRAAGTNSIIANNISGDTPNVASGAYAFAEGLRTEATGAQSHAEGKGTKATNYYAHAEGNTTEANGSASLAEGTGTIANGAHQHVQGKYNVADKSGTSAVYAHIVGWGASDSDTDRKNIHTISTTGEAWFQGDIYVKSTGGKNKDTGSKKLATEEYVNTQISNIKTPEGGDFVDTNTTYDLSASKNSTNGNAKLNLTASGSGTGTDSVTVKGSGATTVTTDSNGVININSTDTNTHYTSKNVVGASSTATANATVSSTTNAVYLNHLEENTVKSTHKITGSGSVKVSSDSSGNITISGTDTTYTSLKNPNSLIVQGNGTQSFTYDGSTAKTLNIKAGTNVSVSSNTSGEITISATDTKYSAAGSSLGLVKSGGDVTISNGEITVNDDSHNHVISNIDGLQGILEDKLNTSLKGAANGLAELDSNGKVPSSQLSSNKALIVEYSNGNKLCEYNGSKEFNLRLPFTEYSNYFGFSKDIVIPDSNGNLMSIRATLEEILRRLDEYDNGGSNPSEPDCDTCLNNCQTECEGNCQSGECSTGEDCETCTQSQDCGICEVCEHPCEVCEADCELDCQDQCQVCEDECEINCQDCESDCEINCDVNINGE